MAWAPGGLGGDLVEMKLHGFGVAGRQHKSSAGAALGTYRAEQIGRLSTLIVGRAFLPQRWVSLFFWLTRISP
jgi:hypothetical protein